MSATPPAGDATTDPPAVSPADPAPAADPAAETAEPGLPNGVITALYRLQNAEALHESRLRERLQIGANDLGALRLISRFAVLGQDARAVDVAQSLGVTNGATSVILARLVERGYLTRTANPRDGRGSLLHLTATATTSVGGSLDDSQSRLSLLVSGLSLREARRLVLLLTAVTTSLDLGARPDA